MQGAITAVFLVANIAASLVAVLAFIAFINAILVRKPLYRNILFWGHATSPFTTGSLNQCVWFLRKSFELSVSLPQKK